MIPEIASPSSRRHTARPHAISGRFARGSRDPAVNSRRNALGRVTLTTVDQGFASLSNFAVGAVVGRISGPAGLGAYAVAYAAWLLLATVHRSLVIEPMSIDGDARHPSAPRLLAFGASAELILGMIATGIVVVGGLVLLGRTRSYGLALLTLAPFLAPLLLQDYWRWVGFMQAKPGKALANDTVFNCTQVLALGVFLIAGLRSAEIAIFAWGLGAIAGSLFGLAQFRVGRFTRGGMSLLRSRWHMSKWLTANGLTVWGTVQSYPILVGGILGPAGIGGLRAAQGLVMGPGNVLLQAGGSIGLPESSKAWDERGWPGLRRVSHVVLAAGVAGLGSIAVIVLVAGKTLLSVVYGPEFGQYATAADLFALCCVVQVFGVGAILILKTTNQPRTLFHIGLVALAVTSVSVVVLSIAWGVDGAAVATVFASITTLVGLIRAYRKTAQSLESRPEPGTPTLGDQVDGRGEYATISRRAGTSPDAEPAVPPRPYQQAGDIEAEVLERAGLGSDALRHAGNALRRGDYPLAIEHLRAAAADFRWVATTSGRAPAATAVPATPRAPYRHEFESSHAGVETVLPEDPPPTDQQSELAR